MKSGQRKILKIALPVPLRRCFDYFIDGEAFPDDRLQPGIRVKVPFGKSTSRTGVLISTSKMTELPDEKLKKILDLIDDKPLFSPLEFQLLQWAGNYYHHPIGEVIFNALPALLRQGKPANRKKEYVYRLIPADNNPEVEALNRAPIQRKIFDLLKTKPEGVSQQYFSGKGWTSSLNALIEKGYVSRHETNCSQVRQSGGSNEVLLNPDQKKAVDRIRQFNNEYRCVLLDGVTGSGKTEVYIDIIKYIMDRGQQSLVLVPEIGLTPQLANVFKSRIDANIIILHSALSDGERLQAWLQAKDGLAPVVLGTRSAIWTPLKNPGIIIVDEEHDLSYKQQEGFRYSARDVAIMRGKMNNIPVVLGSATPSMESLYNAISNKYDHIKLKSRAGGAIQPATTVIDLRAQNMSGAFSGALLKAIDAELQQRHQILLFINKRGFSPVIMCHYCGWAGKCSRCNVHLTYHKQENKLSCHHCGTQRVKPDQCPECRQDGLLQIGYGTERLYETLAGIFPSARILRIDRDSTRRKGAMEKMVGEIRGGEADILIGTQMLAKGHDFPNLNMVGILDADRGLFSNDFRASENMAQLIIQVSGRAGRTSDKGRVFIQTHYPDHPLLKTLLDSGYHIFADKLLEERRQAELPPYSYQVLLRAEDYRKEAGEAFLNEARSKLGKPGGIEVFGPFPAPLERRAGRFRYQLLLQSGKRNLLLNTLAPWIPALESLPGSKKVRWSVDVDPLESL